MTDFNKHQPEINDAELEKLLSRNLSQKSDRHLKRLDQRMSQTFAESLQIKHRKQSDARPRAWRLVLSHAVIAAVFFGAGWIFFGERLFESPVQTTQSDSFESRLASPPAGLGTGDADESGILRFEAPVRVAGPSADEPKALLDRVIAMAEFDESLAKLSSTPQASQAQDAAPESGGVAPAETSQSSAMLYKAMPEPEPLGYAAQFQDGFLYVLTPTSVVRIRLDGTESLLENLQSPADWRFDGEGNLLVVDQTSEGAVVYKLKRIEPSK